MLHASFYRHAFLFCHLEYSIESHSRVLPRTQTQQYGSHLGCGHHTECIRARGQLFTGYIQCEFMSSFLRYYFSCFPGHAIHHDLPRHAQSTHASEIKTPTGSFHGARHVDSLTVMRRTAAKSWSPMPSPAPFYCAQAGCDEQLSSRILRSFKPATED
jgi:hypothetical protein